MSKRKKKNKVIKLTEKDYGNYIMSLKDESPVRTIMKTQNEIDKTGP